MLNPLVRDKTKAIPIIPIDPAKAISPVLNFLVHKFLAESIMAVKIDIDALFFFSFGFFAFGSFRWIHLLPA